MNRKFDDDINIFKKSKSRKNKKDRIRLQGKEMKPKTKPRDHDYHLIAREKKSLERKNNFEKILWDLK